MLMDLCVAELWAVAVAEAVGVVGKGGEEAE